MDECFFVTSILIIFTDLSDTDSFRHPAVTVCSDFLYYTQGRLWECGTFVFGAFPQNIYWCHGKTTISSRSKINTCCLGNPIKYIIWVLVGAQVRITSGEKRWWKGPGQCAWVFYISISQCLPVGILEQDNDQNGSLMYLTKSIHCKTLYGLLHK